SAPTSEPSTREREITLTLDSLLLEAQAAGFSRAQLVLAATHYHRKRQLELLTLEELADLSRRLRARRPPSPPEDARRPENAAELAVPDAVAKADKSTTSTHAAAAAPSPHNRSQTRAREAGAKDERVPAIADGGIAGEASQTPQPPVRRGSSDSSD